MTVGIYLLIIYLFNMKIVKVHNNEKRRKSIYITANINTEQ